VALAEFLALYRGRTVSEAELVAICADPRIVHQFFEELAARPAEEDGRWNPRRHVSVWKLGPQRKE
jgi:hypothetical protein